MKKIILVTMALTLSFLYSCGGKKSQSDTFVYGTAGNPVNLDPAVQTDNSSNAVVANVCEGLVGYEGETDTKIVPRLATKWDISSDAKTYTFHLRDGVKFHDGTNMDADAVLFSLTRQQDAKSPYYRTAYTYWQSTGVKDNVESIEKNAQNDIVIKLKVPDSTFLSKMSLPMADIVSPTAYKKLMDAFDQSPVCSGPFVFKQWTKGVQVVLDRNDQYWNKEDLPKIKRVVFKLIPDAEARVLALQKNEIDVAEAIGVQNVKRMTGDMVLLRKPYTSVDYLIFVTDFKPFNDKKVRQAVAYLLDKKSIVEAAAMGYGEPVKNPFPSNIWGYDDQIKDYELNVDKAKQLLAEAGYPDGFEVSLRYNKENDQRKRIAEMIQSSLAKGGIKVNVQLLEWGTLVNVMKWRKEPGMLLFGWVADYIDPDSFLVPMFSGKSTIKPGLNGAGWANEEYDSLNAQALRVADQSKRAEIYAKSQEIFHDELPAVSLYTVDKLFGANKRLKNFEYYSLGYPIFKHIVKE